MASPVYVFEHTGYFPTPTVNPKALATFSHALSQIRGGGGGGGGGGVARDGEELVTRP